MLDHGTPRFGSDGEFLGYTGSCVDLTDRKDAENALRQINQELLSANSDLEQFAYSVSHDLQEPLRNISIFSELLEKRYAAMLDSQAEKFLGTIREGATRIELLLRDLLTFTQVRPSDQSAPERVDANAILESTLSDLTASIRETQARVTGEVLPTVSVRGVHLRQLFQNLIGNAIKYHGEEPPTIHISAEKLDGHCIFSIRDNGIGIDPQFKDWIFGLFKRLHTRNKYSGTGIGLALCQRIVECYGGRIWVESEPGKGSTFHFILPE